MVHPPGTVIVLGGDLARWHAFEQSFQAMIPQLPPGSQVVHATGQWLATAINRCIDLMRPEDQFVHIWADDHVFQPDILNKLLDHNLPIVAPLVCLRSWPFRPSLFHDKDGVFIGYDWSELAGQAGVIPVDAYGGPGVVIRREVIEALGQPFFECMPGSRESPREDLWTFLKCKRSGFQPYCDLDLPIGHCLAAAIFPARTIGGAYGVRFHAQEDVGYLFPSETAEGDEYHAST